MFLCSTCVAFNNDYDTIKAAPLPLLVYAYKEINFNFNNEEYVHDVVDIPYSISKFFLFLFRSPSYC